MCNVIPYWVIEVDREVIKVICGCNEKDMTRQGGGVLGLISRLILRIDTFQAHMQTFRSRENFAKCGSRRGPSVCWDVQFGHLLLLS